MNAAPIDVCDAASFDPGLARASRRTSTLWSTPSEPIMRTPWPTTCDAGSAEASSDPRKPRAWAFQAFREGLIGNMEARTIQAGHNTRKTDAEVQVLGRDGPHLSIRHCLGWNEPTGEDDCRSTSEERITNPNRSRR